MTRASSSAGCPAGAGAGPAGSTRSGCARTCAGGASAAGCCKRPRRRHALAAVSSSRWTRTASRRRGVLRAARLRGRRHAARLSGGALQAALAQATRRARGRAGSGDDRAARAARRPGDAAGVRRTLARALAREEQRIRRALGDGVLRLEHVGSTSVPGLVAKPRIDILLVVSDAADEPSYVPALEAAGYTLRVREPDWHEHRRFIRSDAELNLHIFGPDSPEVERLLRFRDRLRSDTADRERYAVAKRELAARHWRHMQDYADAKSDVIEAILARGLPS